MNKEEIYDLRLEIIQRYNSIRKEKKVIETLKSLIETSGESMSCHQESIGNLEAKIADAFLRELKAKPSAPRLLNLVLSDSGEKNTFEAVVRKELIEGFPLDGLKLQISRAQKPVRFNIEAFAKIFQKLLDKYVNVDFSEPSAPVTIFVEYEHRVWTIFIYKDHGI